VVTAVAKGTAVITVTTQDGARVATSTVTVTQPVSRVRTLSSLRLAKGRTAVLPFGIQPYDADNQGAAFSSSNKRVATVNSSGVVRARATGTATITVTSQDGERTARCTVRVVARPTAQRSLAITPGKQAGLVVGRMMQVRYRSTPTAATGVVPAFTSSNRRIAVIDRAGWITALSPGRTTITVRTGGKVQRFVLTVGTVAPTRISLSQSKATLDRGKKASLRVKAWAPANADPKTVTWTSSNRSAATVNSRGVVTARQPGKTTITATTWNGRTARCTITVR